MKRFKSLIIVILLLLTGCRAQNTLYELSACGSYGVPGMFCSDLKNGTVPCKKLDEDNQGRVLFEYTTYSVITKKTETAVVICQISNAHEVCFYEDLCYYLGEPDAEKTTELKVQNDWGKPLDHSKMAKRSYSITIDLYLQANSGLDFFRLKTACCREFSVEEDDFLEIVFLDKNHSGQNLYWIELVRNSNLEKYIIVVNAEYEITQMQVSGSSEDITNLVLFKEQNAWYSK